jgi:hypothetical protein
MQSLEDGDKALQTELIKMKLVGLQSTETIKLKFLNALVEKYQILHLPQRNFPQLCNTYYNVQTAKSAHYHTRWMTDKSRFSSQQEQHTYLLQTTLNLRPNNRPIQQ